MQQSITVRGHLENGVIVPEENLPFPEHKTLLIKIMAEEPAGAEEAAQVSFLDHFKDLIEPMPELPADLSSNLDHYLYGLPKKD